MKPLIFTFTGETGTGTARIVEYITKLCGVPILPTYTNNKNSRLPNSRYVSNHVLDLMSKDLTVTYFRSKDKIFTYLTLKKDLKAVNLCVMNVKTTQKFFWRTEDNYIIKKIRIKRSLQKRNATPMERRADGCRFRSMHDFMFDKIIDNEGLLIEAVYAVHNYIQTQIRKNGRDN